MYTTDLRISTYESLTDTLTDIMERQRRHREKRLEGTNERTCLHDSCSECEGTGRKKRDGSICVHFISCPCPKCTPRF